jgi:hypothetical protein
VSGASSGGKSKKKKKAIQCWASENDLSASLKRSLINLPSVLPVFGAPIDLRDLREERKSILLPTIASKALMNSVKLDEVLQLHAVDASAGMADMSAEYVVATILVYVDHVHFVAVARTAPRSSSAASSSSSSSSSSIRRDQPPRCAN